MSSFELADRPVHLGLGATAVVLPPFDGTMEWYQRYGEAHSDDGAEGRLVALHRFEKDWSTWEMHPRGAELVLVTRGRMTLVQKVDGELVETELTAGQAAVNPPGVWHTAKIEAPTEALFITAGEGTVNAAEPG